MTKPLNEDGTPKSIPRVEPAPTATPATTAPTEDEIRTRERAMEFAQLLLKLTPKVVVTPVLVTINLSVFLLMLVSGVHYFNPTVLDLLTWGADHGPNVLNGELWRPLTATFVHVGILHIAMNMYILASVGPLVERLVGNVGFAVLYLAAGLGGSLVSLCYDPLIVSAGASGAVFGVYGALIAVLRQKSGAIPQEVLTRIRKSGLAFVGYNLLLGFMIPQIDNAAHIGGLAVGFLCGLVLNLPLAPESLAKRAGRNALAAMLGAVLVLVGVSAVNVLHADLGNAMTELDRAAEIEGRVREVYTTARTKWGQSESSAAGFADVIECDVLPEWRASADRLATFHNVPSTVHVHLTAVLKYMRLRQEAWELEAQAAREDDDRKMRRAEETHIRAREASEKLAPPGK